MAPGPVAQTPVPSAPPMHTVPEPLAMPAPPSLTQQFMKDIKGEGRHQLPLANIGPGVANIARLSKAVVGDVSANVAGAEFAGNVPAFFTPGAELPLTSHLREAGAEEAERGEFPWRSALGETAAAGAEMIPKMLLMRSAGGGLGRQTVAAGAVFGVGPDGEFHVKDAAVGAAFPALGLAGRMAVGKSLSAWISSGGTKALSEPAKKTMEFLGENALQSAFQLAVANKDLRELYAKKDKTEFKRELAKMTAMQLGFMLYGSKPLLDKKVQSFTSKYVKETAEAKTKDLSDAKLAAIMEARENLGGMDRQSRAQNMVRMGQARTLEEALDRIDVEQPQVIPPRANRVAELRQKGATEAQAEVIADRQEADFEGAAGRKAEVTMQRMAPQPTAQVPVAPPVAPVAPDAVPVAAAPVPVAPETRPPGPEVPKRPKPEQSAMNPVDAHEFSQWARGKTVSDLRQLRSDHEDDPAEHSDHAIEIINEIIAEKSKSLTMTVGKPEAPTTTGTAGAPIPPTAPTEPTAPAAPGAAPAPVAPTAPVTAKPKPAPIPKSGLNLPEGVTSRDVYTLATSAKITKEEALKRLQEAHATAQKALEGEDVDQSDIDPNSNTPFSTGKEGEMRIATVDEKTGRVVISPSNLAKELAFMSPGEREAYVKSTIGEERYHAEVMKTFPEHKQVAEQFVKNLSAIERGIARKIIQGRFRGKAGDEAWRLGHEAMRYRLQRIHGMTPVELLGLARRERWTLQSLDLVAGAVRTMREFANSSGATQNMRWLDKVEANIAAVQAELSGEAPFSSGKKRKLAAEQTMGLPGISAPAKLQATTPVTPTQEAVAKTQPVSPGKQEELFDKTGRALQQAHGVVAGAKPSIQGALAQDAEALMKEYHDLTIRQALNLVQLKNQQSKFQAPLGAKESLTDQMDLMEFSKGKVGEITSEWNEVDTFASRKNADQKVLELTEGGDNARLRKVGDEYVVEIEKKLAPVPPKEEATLKENERIADLAEDLPLELEEGPMPSAQAQKWISTIFKDKGEPFITSEKGETAVGYMSKFGKPAPIVRGRGADLNEAMHNLASYSTYLATGPESPMSYNRWSQTREKAAVKAEQEKKQVSLFSSGKRRKPPEGSEQTRMFFGDLLWSDQPKPEDIKGKPGAFEAGAMKPAINKQELDELAKQKIIEEATGIQKGEAGIKKEILKGETGTRKVPVMTHARKGGSVFKEFVRDLMANKGLKPGQAEDLWAENLPPALMGATGDELMALRSRYNLGRVLGQTHSIADPPPEFVKAVGEQLTLDELSGAKTSAEVGKVLQKAIQRGAGETGKRVGQVEKLMRERKKWSKSPDKEMKKYMLGQIDSRLDELANQEGQAPVPEAAQLPLTEGEEPMAKYGKIQVPRETTPRKGTAPVRMDYTGMKPGQPRWKEVMDRMRVLETKVDARGNMRPQAQREWDRLERFAVKALEYVPGTSKKSPEFTPAQRYRLKVIAELLTVMRAESQPGSQESLSRKSITSEDLSAKGPDVIEQPAYRKLNQTRANSPEWRQSLVDDARHHGRPEEETKRLLVVEDQSDGSLHLLSIYESGHRGIRVADPAGAHDISIGDLFSRNAEVGGEVAKRYRPRYSVLLDEPVKNFRQKFDSMARYRGEFGNEARANAEAFWYSGGDPETLAAMHGERGLRRGSRSVQLPEMPPTHGPLEIPSMAEETIRSERSMHWRKALSGAMEQGGALQAPEARAVVNEIGGMAGLEPNIAEVMDSIRALGLSAKTARDVDYPKAEFQSAYSKAPWQAISGLQKMMEREMRRAKISQEEALYNVGFRVMRILKNPHLSEENLMRSYGPRPEQLPPSAGERNTTGRELTMLTPDELKQIDEIRSQAGLRRASTERAVSQFEPATGPVSEPVPPKISHTAPDVDPWWRQGPPGILTKADIDQIYREIEAEGRSGRIIPEHMQDIQKLRRDIEAAEPRAATEEQQRADERYRRLTQKRTTPPEIQEEGLYSSGKKRREATKATVKVTNYLVRNPVNSILGWYSSWLSDAVRRSGSENAGRMADLADIQIDRTKKVYGDLTPVVDVARKVAGRANKSTAWMNDVIPIPGAEFAAESNYIRGTEDNLAPPVTRQEYDRTMFPDRGAGEAGPVIPYNKVVIPDYAKDDMNILDKANRAVGKVYEAVIENFKASGRIQRNMTAAMYEIIRGGEGSKDSPNEQWHQLVEANALINGYSKDGVSRVYREWKEKLDKVHLSADGIDQVNQDFQRKFPRVVTHLRLGSKVGKVNIGTGWQEMVHSKPFSYIETAAQRAAHTRAFREIFPATDEGRHRLNGLRDLAEQEMGPSGQKDLQALLRTMQGHPSDSYEAPGWARTGTFPADLARAANQNLMNPLAKLALTAQTITQSSETVVGATAQYLGYRNVGRAIAALVKEKSLRSELEKEGAWNRVVYDFSYDPASPVRTWSRRLQNGISVGFAENAVNELQEKMAAAAAHVVAERIVQKQLDAFEKRQLPATFKAMQFTPDQVTKLMAGDAEMLGMFKRRAAAWLTSGNRAIAETSRLGSNKLINSLFRFMSYPMMKTNQLRRVYTNFAEAFSGGTNAEKKAAGEQALRFFAFNTAQGALLSIVTAALTGGRAGVRQEFEDFENAPGLSLLEFFGASIGGPLYMVMRGTRQSGFPEGVLEQAARAFFPYSVGRELTDMKRDAGRYRGMSWFEKMGTFVQSRTPASKSIKLAMATMGLSDEDVELTQALKAYRGWRRETKEEDIYRSGVEEDVRQFRVHMRRANDALKLGHYGVANLEIARATMEKELTGKDVDEAKASAKSSLESRKTASKLDELELIELRERIGSRAVNHLLMHDELLDSVIDGI